MTVTVELTAPPADIDHHALDQAAARLGAVVPRHTQVRLKVTTDFDDTVRRTLPDDGTGAVPYRQERDFGFALAKTITQADGSVDIVVDAGLLRRSGRPGDAEQTFEHEGLHIAIEGRGESRQDVRVQRGRENDSAAEIFASIAGVSAEERLPRPRHLDRLRRGRDRRDRRASATWTWPPTSTRGSWAPGDARW